MRELFGSQGGDSQCHCSIIENLEISSLHMSRLLRALSNDLEPENLLSALAASLEVDEEFEPVEWRKPLSVHRTSIVDAALKEEVPPVIVGGKKQYEFFSGEISIIQSVDKKEEGSQICPVNSISDGSCWSLPDTKIPSACSTVTKSPVPVRTSIRAPNHVPVSPVLVTRHSVVRIVPR